MPDIFRSAAGYWFIGDTVEIPDSVAEEDRPEEDGEDAEGGKDEDAETGEEEEAAAERRLAERRRGDRRQTDRRAEDGESTDSVIRRYRERLLLTKEEFFSEIEPELLEELGRQMEEVKAEAYRDELVKQGRQITNALAELERGKKVLAESHEEYMREFTEELKYMALSIAERILHKEIEEDKHALEMMALQLVSEVKNASWINVEVSEQVEGLAEHLKTQLNKAEQGKTIFVETKDAPPDTCRIATEEGVINATLSVQLRQLREAFVKAEEEGD